MQPRGEKKNSPTGQQGEQTRPTLPLMAAPAAETFVVQPAGRWRIESVSEVLVHHRTRTEEGQRRREGGELGGGGGGGSRRRGERKRWIGVERLDLGRRGRVWGREVSSKCQHKKSLTSEPGASGLGVRDLCLALFYGGRGRRGEGGWGGGG